MNKNQPKNLKNKTVSKVTKKKLKNTMYPFEMYEQTLLIS